MKNEKGAFIMAVEYLQGQVLADMIKQVQADIEYMELNEEFNKKIENVINE